MLLRSILTHTVLLFALAHTTIAHAQSQEPAVAVVIKGGVADNLEVMLREYVSMTTTGQIAKRSCSEADWTRYEAAAIQSAVESNREAWIEANAQILVDNLEPQKIAVALTYEPQRMLAETYGALPPDVLQTALDTKVRPILQPALAQVISELLDHCAPSQ